MIKEHIEDRNNDIPKWEFFIKKVGWFTYNFTIHRDGRHWSTTRQITKFILVGEITENVWWINYKYNINPDDVIFHTSITPEIEERVCSRLVNRYNIYKTRRSKL